MNKIKNIIFDLGGVFMDIDFSRTEKAFVDLGVTNFKELFTQHHASPLFEDLETGKISPEVFYAFFREQTKADLTDEQIKGAWNALLINFPPERLNWLEQIKHKYNIYLFSNTNQIHYDAFMDIFNQETGKDDFNQYFIKAYYSQTLGLRKPYKESYLKIIEEQNLIAAETLFIDDTPKNITGAKEAGLQAILLAPPLTVLDLDL
jgi:putative hydrolase of the HAD superfamily